MEQGVRGSGDYANNTMRKVMYDEYTNTFYVETRLEALERQVATRTKTTDVLNRSHDTQLRSQHRQVDAQRHIFYKKNERESTFHKEQLKDHVAHRDVLDDIGRSRYIRDTGGRAQSHLGFYGLGASKRELQPLIEQKIKDNSPSAMRKRRSFTILSKRRGVKVFDRTKTTSALLRMKTEIHSRPMTNFKASENASSQLILPPLTVRWASHQSTDNKGQTICASKNDDSRASRERSKDTFPLPTVFVTQSRL